MGVVGWGALVCQGKEKKMERGKGGVEEYTCLSARGHFLIKHCTPSPSTGHLNSNSAVHIHSADVPLSLFHHFIVCLSFILSRHTQICNYKAISFVGNIL